MKLTLFLYITFFFLPPISYSQELPSWILSQEMAGFSYCAVGEAGENNNLALQKKIARMNALSELSKTIEISINNEIEIEKKVTRSNNREVSVEKDVSSSSRQLSNSVINEAIETNNYLDNKTGIYYIKLCIK